MLFLIFRKMEPLLFDESLLPLGSVGAVECNEAAIFPQTLEFQAKDQKIKRSQPSAAPTEPSGSKLPEGLRRLTALA